MFERLSVPARQVIVRARDESERFDDGLALDTGHLLVGLAGCDGDQSERALSAVGATPALIQSTLEVKDRGREPGRLGHFAADLTRVIEAASSRRGPAEDVTTADLLLATIDTECVGRDALTNAGIDMEGLRLAAISALTQNDPVWKVASPTVWTVTVESDDPDEAWNSGSP